MSADPADNISPLHDLKEISKRTYQLGFIAIGLLIIITIYQYVISFYASCVLSGCFCLSIITLLLLNYKQILKNIKLPIVIMVCFFLTASAVLGNGATGQYLYFFPLLVIIPIIVDSEKNYKRDVFTYFGISILSAAACIIIGRNVTPLEYISAVQVTRIFYVNVFSAITLTTAFAFVNIYFERKYLKELMDQKNHVITSRTRFLSVMGHELRTPLNGILGATNILMSGKSLPEQQQYIDILKYCADHMLLQVNDILDFNKIEAGMLDIHPLAVNLKGLLLNSAKPFYTTAHDKKLELVVEIDPILDTAVLLDDVRFVQILNNLYSNAIKFTQSGYVKLKAVCESKTNDQMEVTFAVEDSGQGIAPQDQKRIFDSFAQVYDERNRKITGTGLGLNISKRLIKLMGSRLELKSETGKGSTFFFRLKLTEVSTPVAAAQPEIKADEDLAGVNILLVEDNKINLLIAKKILSDYKAVVTTAYNGAEALAALDKKADFTIILMDLEMPVMNGYEAVPIMKKNYPEIPVLAFTAAMIDREKLISLQTLGFEDCVFKPFQPHELLSQIKKYIKIAPLSVIDHSMLGY